MKKYLVVLSMIGMLVSCQSITGKFANNNSNDSTATQASEQVADAHITEQAVTEASAEVTSETPATEPATSANQLPSWMQGVWTLMLDDYEFFVTINGKYVALDGHHMLSDSGMRTDFTPYIVRGNTIVRKNDNRTVLSFNSEKRKVYFNFFKQFSPDRKIHELKMTKVEE